MYASKTFTPIIRYWALGLSLLVLSSCGSEVKEHSQTIAYQTVLSQTLVLKDRYQHMQTYTGTIRSANTTGIGFELAGKLNNTLVDSGDTVNKGQILAQLDTDLLVAEQQQLQASLLQTQADIDLAKSTLARTQKLKQQNYVSEQQLDETQQQVISLQANQKRIEASLSASNLKIEKSTLLAPFNGTISQRFHNVGEVIALGSPVFTLVGNSQPLAYIGVPIDIAQQLTAQQRVDVRVGKQTFTANIAGISAEVNTISRTVQLRINLPDSANVINGEIAYLAYQQDVPASGYWVPMSALTDGVRGLWNVFALVEAEQGFYTIERRDVEIIYTNEQQAYIQGAIKPTDLIVSQGLHKLVVNQKVTLAQAEQAGTL
ncbi:efflux RND transporter periplasmic adaptor subunit [Shewanella livingstonensis]|uniref:Efflux RND transporter periplasmic adaptor subunit n=1 Tax=Shewanella livingstonensis TaxID=150120 RepID=A0A3G8LTS7_9GAMM|nr:efflux RND transporter periplasmic adaptor subunit [Shewanella livingstonensis]AZG72625.1 efflux RND transporter periplasmic adaptor subunit [Shewanella livingstonensis]